MKHVCGHMEDLILGCRSKNNMKNMKWSCHWCFQNCKRSLNNQYIKPNRIWVVQSKVSRTPEFPRNVGFMGMSEVFQCLVLATKFRNWQSYFGQGCFFWHPWSWVGKTNEWVAWCFTIAQNYGGRNRTTQLCKLNKVLDFSDHGASQYELPFGGSV